MINKILLAFAFGLILLINQANASLCQDQNPINNIPCTIVTPVLYCNDNVNITDLNTLQKYNQSMSLISSGIYNFTFNYSIGSYSILLCDGSTASIQVVNGDTVNYNLGGAGFTNPDPSAVIDAVKDEIKGDLNNKFLEYSKTTKMIFWLALLGFICGVLVFINYRNRRIDIITQKVADKLSIN